MKKRTFNHGDRETRLHTAQQRMECENPFCIICGHAIPFALELHHVAGRKYHVETVRICANHHANASDFQKDHPAKIQGCKNPLEPIGHFLLGLGDLLQIVVDALVDPTFADFLQYLRNKLKEFGLLLIEATRNAPDLDLGITP